MCYISLQLKMTPLHWAVQRGFEECVEALLRFGADVNLDNKFGKTPFEIASGINRQDLIELLQVNLFRSTQVYTELKEEKQYVLPNYFKTFNSF